MKIISGGQTGADQIALQIAKKCGLETGGTAPKDYLTESGSNFELKTKYGLTESKYKSYPPRTKQNIKDSNATLIFKHPSVDTNGTNLTVKLCKEMNKPYLIIDTDDYDMDTITEFVLDKQVLNIAGHRASKTKFLNYNDNIKIILKELFNS